MTYAVSAWVRVDLDVGPGDGGGSGSGSGGGGGGGSNSRRGVGGSSSSSSQSAGDWASLAAREARHEVNVALSVDGEWVNAGCVSAGSSEWVRCWGSFRVEKEVSRAVLYVQGPPPGVAILLADVRVNAVDWKARLPQLRAATQQVR